MWAVHNSGSQQFSICSSILLSHYWLHNKSAVLVAVSLEQYQQICRPIAQLHHDGSTEFLGVTSAYCCKLSIQKMFMCPYSLFQNSNAESTVGYVKHAGWRILLESGLPDLLELA